MSILDASLVTLLFASFAFSAPAPQLGGLLNGVGGVVGGVGNAVDGVVSPVVDGVATDVKQGTQIFTAVLGAVSGALEPGLEAIPTSIPDALDTIEEVFDTAESAKLVDQVVDLIPHISTTQLEGLLAGTLSEENSSNSNNPINPTEPIYPTKSDQDAPYSLTEETLRAAIYIPPTFTYGAKPPVILVPGSGTTGYQSFVGNYIKLLSDVDYADTVWLNIPPQLLGDAQLNAEYVAYAINYISAITSRRVSLITWSQGGLITQWALKYFPSTRATVNQFIAHSPDFRGSVTAFAVCPGFPDVPCPPAIVQQQFDSDFVRTLRMDGGDSAYVPTTTVFSATDLIVQPQNPVEEASAFLKDDCGVGVTNAQVQDVCGILGSAYTHEGILYNPLAYAVTVFALQNGRPADIDGGDIDLETVCAQLVSPGLDVADVLLTEETIPIALASIALYTPKVFDEPPVMAYASQSVASCSSE